MLQALKQTKKYHFTLVILWCRQMGRPMGVQSHDYQYFLDAWITQFSYPWCSAAHTSCIQELCLKCCLFLTLPRRHKEQSGSPFLLNPLSPNIHIQILQTDLHTSPLRISWENLIKDHGIFSMMIILLILITLFLDSVWILLGENCFWTLLGLKGLK